MKFKTRREIKYFDTEGDMIGGVTPYSDGIFYAYFFQELRAQHPRLHMLEVKTWPTLKEADQAVRNLLRIL